MTLWWKISVVEAVLVCCPECTGWRGSHISLPWLNRAWCITPLTHDHPSFLSSSFCPKLRYTPRYPSINTKETLQRLLFGESMFRWPSSNFQTLRINWTRPLSTPSSTAFIVRSDKVKTCRINNSARIRDFYSGSRSSGFESAKLRGVRGILGSFLSRPGTIFSLRSHTACLTLLHHYVNTRTAISLISPPVGKIYTGVLASRVEVIDRPRPLRLALFLLRVPIRFGWKCRTDGDGCGGYQNVYGWK